MCKLTVMHCTYTGADGRGVLRGLKTILRARARAREILCATPTFGGISARVRMHMPLNFELFHCS